MPSLAERIHFRDPKDYKKGDVVITNEQIQERLQEIVPEIVARFSGQRLLVLGILKGGRIVTDELVDYLRNAGMADIEEDFIAIKSYGFGTTATEEPRTTQDLHINPDGRRLLVVDDIGDTLKTFKFVTSGLKSRGALEVATFALLEKPERREVDFPLDYTGITVPNMWLQGHGMDAGFKTLRDVGRDDFDIRRGPWNPNKKRHPLVH